MSTRGFASAKTTLYAPTARTAFTAWSSSSPTPSASSPSRTMVDTFLVGQWRYPLDLYSWEIPEGGGSLSVPLLDSARRELIEETGLTAAVWTDLGPFHLSNSVTNETGQVFLAQDLTLGDAQPEGDEVLRVRRLPLTEAYAMAMDGRITDGVSIIGLARAVRWLEGR